MSGIPWTFDYDATKCPCKDCKNRTIECHGTCDLYKYWLEHKPKTKKIRFKDRSKKNETF